MVNREALTGPVFYSSLGSPVIEHCPRVWHSTCRPSNWCLAGCWCHGQRNNSFIQRQTVMYACIINILYKKLPDIQFSRPDAQLIRLQDQKGCLMF